MTLLNFGISAKFSDFSKVFLRFLHFSFFYIPWIVNSDSDVRFYLDVPDMSVIDEFVAEIQLLSLIPGTSMRGLFLQGDLSVEEYAYSAAIRKYAFLISRIF